MKDKIELYNVNTHNLKNISVSIPKNKITAIYGRSGAGKSSLAFSTLYQLCYDEFESLENGFNDNSQYKLSGYNGIIPSVAVSQNNKNNNPRSTLYSFLNIAQIISSLRIENSIPYSLLKLNKPDNECPYCNGLGYVSEISIHELIDENRSILENPFRIWRSGYLSELYHNLLIKFCEIQSIPINVRYKELLEKDKEKILYGCSHDKILVRYKHNGKYKQRKLFYEGVIPASKEKINLSSMSEIKNITECSHCLGSRVNYDIYHDIQINGINFIELLTAPLIELRDKLKDQAGTFYNLYRIFDSICEMGLGYISLNRSIPSLSGGELQKLKFSRILNSNISGVLFVIDEISSQLSDDYYPVIFNKLKNLSKNNTIVLVDHNSYFIERADVMLHIGKFPGDQGGYICDNEKIQPLNIFISRKKTKDFFKFENINKNNLINQSVNIPKKSITVFTGISGCGKSSLGRWIESYSNAIYITQKNSNYSSRSVLASTLKVSNVISDYFSKKTGLPTSEFLLNKNAGCKHCNGIGVMKYERGFEKDLYLDCHYCSGELFDKNNSSIYKTVDGLSLVDYYQTDINELIKKIPQDFSELKNILETAAQLGLGHLKLSRKTQSLSGGETRRLKLCEHLSRQKETKRILIIDEPIAGLDSETASQVSNFIYQKAELFSAVILIEHRKEVLPFVVYEVKIGPYSSNNGGKVLSQEFLG